MLMPEMYSWRKALMRAMAVRMRRLRRERLAENHGDDEDAGEDGKVSSARRVSILKSRAGHDHEEERSR